MPRLLTKEEKDAIWTALGLRKNIIETGTYELSADSVKHIGVKAAKEEYGAEIRALETSQMELVILSEKLVRAALQDRLMIIEE